ncbi:hypothetical protein A2415_01010 [candidate division WWE3 bacterium RIFOXYC1_FULL_39_7]|uniref:Uncharacterized protein n=2 Tax=Katanobacteria TaxID=422282 RepID=A0A1F4X4U2_UNCKA|nr:MAG: hypothetical protein A2415_01010 [candidate division WWE3 bacterium RIFOXYC1_FULL_39_7]OGC76695.1 MAG: hypothetical protein A2619_05565 [candidate division WWE3 bacterium RIFOXYD1_FULL_39_9]
MYGIRVARCELYWKAAMYIKIDVCDIAVIEVPVAIDLDRAYGRDLIMPYKIAEGFCHVMMETNLAEALSGAIPDGLFPLPDASEDYPLFLAGGEYVDVLQKLSVHNIVLVDFGLLE